MKTSAPRSSLLTFDMYQIKTLERSTEENPKFGVYRDGDIISTHQHVKEAVLSLAEHLTYQRSALLDRVSDPEITITYSVR